LLWTSIKGGKSMHCYGGRSQSYILWNIYMEGRCLIAGIR
jgi:hypothetical protein